MSKQATSKKKNVTKASEDLRVDRKSITKISIVNINNPSVIEINTSLFAVPNEQREICEYEEQINRITSHASKALRAYVREHQDLFEKKCILDINFTSANLRKGYNKSVQLSLFVRQKNIKTFTKIRNDIKETIKPVINSITNKITAEDFKCYKKKQVINAKG